MTWSTVGESLFRFLLAKHIRSGSPSWPSDPSANRIKLFLCAVPREECLRDADGKRGDPVRPRPPPNLHLAGYRLLSRWTFSGHRLGAPLP